MALGVAVLGTGRIGGRYIDVVKKTPGAEIRVVAEPREEQVAPLKKKHPDVEFVADYRDAIAAEGVDVIIGTLPHWLHKQAAIDAANAGKHIYMEKPMAVWLHEADEMLAVAHKNGVKLMTAHTQRYYPHVKKIKEIIESKSLGDLIMVHDMWHKVYKPYDRPQWMLVRSKGGGMGQMDGSHLIDRMLWLVGDDVYSVNAQVGAFTYPELDCDDTGMYFLRWKSGRVATVSRIAWRNGATASGSDLFFTNGMAKFRRGSGPDAGVWVADGPNGEWKQVPFDAGGEDSSLLEEFTAFIKSVERGDADTPIPQMHGRHVLEILEATEKSAETGREVILA